MTDEQNAFMATIRAAPDDDVPRFVYADWLEEHGFVEWAAFIRSSCQILNPDRHGLDLAALVEREAELHRLLNAGGWLATVPGIAEMTPFAFSWNGDLFAPEVSVYEFEQPDPAVRLKFRRGFVVGIAGELRDVRAFLPALLLHHTVAEAVPVDHLEFGMDRDLPAELERFVDSYINADTVPDDIFDDPARYFSVVLIAEARLRMGQT